MSAADKLARLRAAMKAGGRVAVAFSSGVDSTFLLAVASDTLGKNVLALTADSLYIPRFELEEAKDFCAAWGIRHLVLPFGIPDEVRNNPEDRCYLCKSKIFRELQKRARAEGFEALADGTNADDAGQHRPGLRALAELGVRSPLRDAGLTKSEIRELSRGMKLPTWDKPPYACLLTRLPYGTPVSEAELGRIEKAEGFLMSRGIRFVRVRSHGSLARIVAGGGDFRKLLEPGLLAEAATALKSFGYEYVTVDCEPYATEKKNES